MSEGLRLGDLPNVVALPGVVVPTNDPKPALVKVMRDLLEMAESGRLQVFIGTGWMADGNRITAWGGVHDNVYEMLGAIEWMREEYVDRIKTQNPDPERPVT